jgi:hypothetical protein
VGEYYFRPNFRIGEIMDLISAGDVDPI